MSKHWIKGLLTASIATATIFGFVFRPISAAAQPAPTSAQTPKRILLALSKADHTLVLVDPSTLKIVTRLPVGTDPHEVIASSDGTKAYVTIYGGGTLHEIDVLDLVAQKALTP